MTEVTRQTAPVTPSPRARAARAAYEARYRAVGYDVPVPWEEMSVDERERWWLVAEAVIKAWPGPGAPIGETRALLAAPLCFEGLSTVGELLAAFTIDTWKAEPRLAVYKTEVYLAAIRAGLIPGVAVGDRIGELDIAAAEALTEDAIRAMGQPPAGDGAAAAVRSMVARKQEAIAAAGQERGLGPVWHEATFTAAEILAALEGAPAPEPAEAHHG